MLRVDNCGFLSSRPQNFVNQGAERKCFLEIGLAMRKWSILIFLNKRCRKVKKIPINNLVLWEFSAGIRRRFVRWRKVRTPQSGIPFEKTGRAPKGSRMESAAENKPPRKR